MHSPASLKNRVAIVGVGESDIGKVPHMTGLGLNAQAARRALDDAGLKRRRHRRRAHCLLVHRAVLHARLGAVRIPGVEAALQRLADLRRREPRRHAQARCGSDRRRAGRDGAGVRRREPRHRRQPRRGGGGADGRGASVFRAAVRHFHPGLLRHDRAAPHARVRHHARAHGARGGEHARSCAAPPQCAHEDADHRPAGARRQAHRRPAGHAGLLPHLGCRGRVHRDVRRACQGPEGQACRTSRASGSTTPTSTSCARPA